MGIPDRERSPAELKLIERVTKITARLPQVDIGTDGFGHATFKVAKKSLVLIGADAEAANMAIKSDVETQRALVRLGPWVRTPYIGQHGWVSISSRDRIDWKQVAELIEDAYRKSAPKRLLGQLGS